jgi:hypothetical protein
METLTLNNENFTFDFFNDLNSFDSTFVDVFDLNKLDDISSNENSSTSNENHINTNPPTPQYLNFESFVANDLDILKTNTVLNSPITICLPELEQNGVKYSNEIILNFEPNIEENDSNSSSTCQEKIDQLDSEIFNLLNNKEDMLSIEVHSNSSNNDEDDDEDDEEISSISSPDSSSPSSSNYVDLSSILTSEEKSVYIKEGYKIPCRLPLTKSEEKILKLVKRKIRNKKSAHVSRERKKKYVDGLEKRVDLCTKENEDLQKQVSQLKNHNS